MEFFVDLKNIPFARIYTGALLTRRVIFIGVVLFLTIVIDRTIIYSILFSVQVIYCGLLVSLLREEDNFSIFQWYINVNLLLTIWPTKIRSDFNTYVLLVNFYKYSS